MAPFSQGLVLFSRLLKLLCVMADNIYLGDWVKPTRPLAIRDRVVMVELLSRVWLFCNPMDRSPPGSSIHGISQPRILEWAAISFSGDLPDPGIKPASPAWQADSLPMSYLGSLPSGTPVPHQWYTGCRTLIGKLWGSKHSFPKSGQGLFNNYIFILTY